MKRKQKRIAQKRIAQNGKVIEIFVDATEDVPADIIEAVQAEHINTEVIRKKRVMKKLNIDEDTYNFYQDVDDIIYSTARQLAETAINYNRDNIVAFMMFDSVFKSTYFETCEKLSCGKDTK